MVNLARYGTKIRRSTANVVNFMNIGLLITLTVHYMSRILTVMSSNQMMILFPTFMTANSQSSIMNGLQLNILINGPKMMSIGNNTLADETVVPHHLSRLNPVPTVLPFMNSMIGSKKISVTKDILYSKWTACASFRRAL